MRSITRSASHFLDKSQQIPIIGVCGKKNSDWRSFAMAASALPFICTALPKKFGNWPAPADHFMRAAMICTHQNVFTKTYWQILRADIS